MTNIASAFKAEISRLSRKEVRGEIAALKKSNTQHRSHIAALRKKVEVLERALKKTVRRAPAADVGDEGDDAGGPHRRFSPSRLAKHRQRLGLSAADFGALMGVSGQSIYKWEAGEARPRRKQLEAIAHVRMLGKREATARLEAIRMSTSARSKPARKRPVARKSAAGGAASAPRARRRP